MVTVVTMDPLLLSVETFTREGERDRDQKIRRRTVTTVTTVTTGPAAGVIEGGACPNLRGCSQGPADGRRTPPHLWPARVPHGGQGAQGPHHESPGGAYLGRPV